MSVGIGMGVTIPGNGHFTMDAFGVRAVFEWHC